MEVDKVADEVADMMADMGVDKVVDMGVKIPIEDFTEVSLTIGDDVRGDYQSQRSSCCNIGPKDQSQN